MSKGHQPVVFEKIHRAAASGNVEELNRLIGSGIDVNQRDDWLGFTPLMAAADVGQLRTAEALLQHGALTDLFDECTFQAIHRAAAHGHLECVRLLLDYGADPNVESSVAGTAWQCAMEHGHEEVAQLLASRGAKTQLRDAGHSLGDAVQGSWPDEVRRCLLAGANPNETVTDDGWLPLHFAVSEGREEIVALLLKHGADPNACGGEYSPLRKAIIFRQLGCMRLLLKQEVPIEPAGGVGDSALHLAARQVYLEGARLLIESGANVNARTRDGETPLLCAVSGYGIARQGENVPEALAVARLLIDHGAEIHACARRRSVLDAANSCSRPEMADFIRTQVLARGSLHAAAANDDATGAELLLDHGANANVREQGQMPLHLAAAMGAHRTATLLLTRGAEVNAKDDARRTPLCIAKECGHEGVAYLLRKHGGKRGWLW